MLRKILTYFGITIVTALFVLYFAFSYILKEEERDSVLCNKIEVEVLDSTINRFVSKDEVISILTSSENSPIGMAIDDISLYDLEKLLEERSAIRISDISLGRDGIMNVRITQRKPLLRIQNAEGGFYVDKECYLFPLEKTFTSYVPIVTGNIPISVKTGQRGNVTFEEEKWLRSVLEFGNYLERSEFWSSQVQQIHILPNKDIALYMRVGEQTILFGGFDDMERKFEKLHTFYKNVIPHKGWDRYSQINLKYADQIVCTLKEEYKQGQ